MCHTLRRFLLEWLSFLHRYVPVGLLEVLPQRLNWRPPAFVGRSDLETWLASENPRDWCARHQPLSFSILTGAYPQLVAVAGGKKVGVHMQGPKQSMA